MLRKRGPALALAALVLVAAYGALVSSHQHPYEHAPGNRNQGAGHKVAHQSAEERIALYTEVLAWFTGVLAVVSALQGFFLYRADKTARISADTAKLAAEAAIAQSKLSGLHLDLTEKQHRLARLQFLASHQPTLQTISFEESEVSEGADGPFKLGASLRYVNAGNADAHLLEIGWHISFAERPLRPGHTMKTHACGDQILQPGEEGGYPLASDLSRNNTVVVGIKNMRVGMEQRVRLRCMGYVLYTDSAGRRHRTGFSRIHDASTYRWDREENPDYEYSY